MVSALDSGSSGPGSGPGRGVLCCVLGQDTLLPPRCINGYRQIMLGVTLRWTSIPSRGE